MKTTTKRRLGYTILALTIFGCVAGAAVYVGVGWWAATLRGGAVLAVILAIVVGVNLTCLPDGHGRIGE